MIVHNLWIAIDLSNIIKENDEFLDSLDLMVEKDAVIIAFDFKLI